MKPKLNWQAYSNADRNKIIEEVKDSISKNDGCIMNFNMYSDLALTLCIEIEEYKIIGLHKTLSCKLTVSDFDVENINLDSKKEWLIFLNMSFNKGTGNLKTMIPAVPG